MTHTTRIHWDVVAVWILILAGVAVFWYTVTLWTLPSDDFTDTGVGCVEDCAEPIAFPIDYWEI